MGGWISTRTVPPTGVPLPPTTATEAASHHPLRVARARHPFSYVSFHLCVCSCQRETPACPVNLSLPPPSPSPLLFLPRPPCPLLASPNNPQPSFPLPRSRLPPLAPHTSATSWWLSTPILKPARWHRCRCDLRSDQVYRRRLWAQ